MKLVCRLCEIWPSAPAVRKFVFPNCINMIAIEECYGRTVVAMPVAPHEAVQSLAGQVDDMVCLLLPDEVAPVDFYYADFTPPAGHDGLSPAAFNPPPVVASAYSRWAGEGRPATT